MSLRLGQLEDPVLQRCFTGQRAAVTCCCFSSKSRQLVSGSKDNSVVVWDILKPESRPLRLFGHKGPVHSVAVNAEFSLIASASQDTTIRLWQPTILGKCKVLKAHAARVRCVGFSPDGRLLLTASDDKTLKLFAIPTRRFLLSLTGHRNWVRACCLGPDGRLALSGGDDCVLRAWDAHVGRCIRHFPDQPGPLSSVACHPDGRTAACGGSDCVVKMWDVRSDQLVQYCAGHSGSVTGIAFHPAGRYMMSASADSTVKIWDLAMGQALFTMHGHAGPACGLAVSPSGNEFASCGADRQLLLWKSNLNSDCPARRECYERLAVQSAPWCRNPGRLWVRPPASPHNADQASEELAAEAYSSCPILPRSCLAGRHNLCSDTLPKEQPQKQSQLKLRPSPEEQPPQQACSHAKKRMDGLQSMASVLRRIAEQMEVLTCTVGSIDSRQWLTEEAAHRLQSRLHALEHILQVVENPAGPRKAA